MFEFHLLDSELAELQRISTRPIPAFKTIIITEDMGVDETFNVNIFRVSEAELSDILRDCYAYNRAYSRDSRSSQLLYMLIDSPESHIWVNLTKA